MWIWLLSMSMAGAPAQPAADDVAAAQQMPGGSCVLFTSGVCICSEYMAEVRDLSCAETGTASEVICSYNVIFEDMSGMEGRFVQQRMDVFNMSASGQWTLTRAYREPAIVT